MNKETSQVALQGWLKKVRDLGLPLVSVGPVEHSQADAGAVRRQIGNGYKLLGKEVCL
jgi:hypothetical protein